MKDRSEMLEAWLSRREFLVSTSAVSVSTFAGCATDSTTSPSENGRESSTAGTIPNHSSPNIEKWVDEVPRPEVVEPVGTKNQQPYYEVEIREGEQKIHRDLPPTTFWGYDGQYPGPTIEARQGEPIYVRWKNKLPDAHLLPVDTTVHDDMIPYDIQGVRVVTHLHGGNIETESDGNASAWFTRDFQETGPGFEKKDYYYVNDQPPTTLWYHDHSIGITRLNVYAGLAGFYLLRNEYEKSLGLPEGEFEIPLVLQDRSFNEDGSLFYPTAISNEQAAEGASLPKPSIIPQFYGDTSVVNGKAWPRLTVKPNMYRFRLLNGANCRYYNLKLLEYDESANELGRDGPLFVQIGNDGGLLPEPVAINGRLELGPSQRADIIVDFTDYAGKTLLLHNNAPSLYRGRLSKENDDTLPLPEVMLVDVGDQSDEQTASQLPKELTKVPMIPFDSVDTKRYLTLTMQSDEYGRMIHLLGTEEKPSGLGMEDPITESPTLGDTEIWSIANQTAMSHPIHLHLVHFQVLGRQPSGDYDPAIDDIELDSIEAPEPYELGWNDVVTIHPAEVVHIIVHFGEFEGLFNDQTGKYMWHCHMIEHEDYDMMRPFQVLPGTESNDK